MKCDRYSVRLTAGVLVAGGYLGQGTRRVESLCETWRGRRRMVCALDRNCVRAERRRSLVKGQTAGTDAGCADAPIRQVSHTDRGCRRMGLPRRGAAPNVVRRCFLFLSFGLRGGGACHAPQRPQTRLVIKVPEGMDHA